MDDHDLREPIVREGQVEGKMVAAAPQVTSPETEDILDRAAHEMFDDDLAIEERDLQEQTTTEAPSNSAAPAREGQEIPAPAAAESEPDYKPAERPTLWYQPDDLQQEEVKAQEAAVREVVGLMLPTPSAVLEGNAASDEIALVPADEISRMNDLSLETEVAQEIGLELGDE